MASEKPIRILACLNASAVAPRVVAAAARLAQATGAPWRAVHVATPSEARKPEAEHRLLLEAFRQAESLGGETLQISGDDAAEELLAYAESLGATHLVVGASQRPAWMELFSPPVPRKLARHGGDFVLEVCTQPQMPTAAWLKESVRPPPLGDPLGYFAATAFVVVATLFALPAERVIALPNVSLIYVLAVIAAAVRYGAATAAFTAVLSALAYNFFLTEPYYTFMISDPSNVWAVFFFLIVGIVVSAVAAHTRAQTRIARRQAAQAREFQALANILVEAKDERAIAEAATQAIARLLYAHAVLFVPKYGELELLAETPGPEMLGGDDMEAAKRALAERREAGRGSDVQGEARWLFAPARGEAAALGVIGVRLINDSLSLNPEERRLLDLAASQTGLALARLARAEDAAVSRVEAESEHVRSALLAAVSHDLKTPLATIRGSVESLLRDGDRHDSETQRELLTNAAAEAEKLSGFIQNLLDAAKLDSGVRAKLEPSDVVDLVDAAIQRAHAKLEGRIVSRDLKSDLPLINVDPVLTQTALANVLENAAQHGPSRGAILVRAYREDGEVAIEVLDEGPGFGEGALPRLFERFERGVKSDGRPPGTGLGLAIAKGFLEAEGAAIEAGNRTDRVGARVRLLFPVKHAA